VIQQDSWRETYAMSGFPRPLLKESTYVFTMESELARETFVVGLEFQGISGWLSTNWVVAVFEYRYGS